MYSNLYINNLNTLQGKTHHMPKIPLIPFNKKYITYAQLIRTLQIVHVTCLLLNSIKVIKV